MASRLDRVIRPLTFAAMVALTSIAPSTTPVAVAQDASPGDMSLRVMTFNIEYGGDEVDYESTVRAILESQPDIVGINEAEGGIERLAAATSWPYFDTRLQVMSRYPIIDPPSANGLWLLVEVAPGRVVAMANVHLPSDPYGPYELRDGVSPDEVVALERTTRLPALQPVLDQLGGLVDAGIPVFLTGDFNAPSHLDWTDANVGQLPQVQGAMPWPVSRAVETAGLRDSWRDVHPDPVAAPGLTWWADRPLVDGYPDHADPQDRIDMVYAGGAATTVASVLVGEQGRPDVTIGIEPWGSDHRAVLSTFDVTPAPMPTLIAVDRRLAQVGEPISLRYHVASGAASRIAICQLTSEPCSEPLLGLPLPPTQPDGQVVAQTGGWATGSYAAALIDPAGETLASIPFWVDDVAAGVRLVVPSGPIPVGRAFTVAWTNGPGFRWDWIGVYPAGADPADGEYLLWRHTETPIEGSVTIDASAEGDTWPLPAGSYDIHYLLDDGSVSLAQQRITIGP